MKQPVAYIAALFCSFAIGAAAQGDTSSAPATAPAGPSKIAVIEFQSAVTATNEFQRDFADLQKKYDPKRQQLKTLNDQVESLKKQLQDQSSTLSEADRQSRAQRGRLILELLQDQSSTLSEADRQSRARVIDE